jgi:molybdate transport system ATP-binding protein
MPCGVPSNEARLTMPGIGVSLKRCGLRLGGKQVLEEVNLDIAPGEKWLLLGANGAGKTQLVKLIGGLRWPSASGRERRIYTNARGSVLDLVDVRERVAYVGAETQDKYARYGWNHTLEQVVTTGLFGTDIPLDLPSPAQRLKVGRLLARFGLAEVAGARMLEVSYGQRRLALVARALAARPQLLLLDEAFNGLDEGHRRILARALAGLRRNRMTLVATAHRVEDVPAGITHAAFVSRGRVKRAGLRSALGQLEKLERVAFARSTAARRSKDPAEPYIELRHAHVFREEVPALLDLDWALRDGENWAVTGRNGSGKSTFLGVLYGAYPLALGGRLLRRGQPPGTPLDEIRSRLAIVSPELQADYEPGATIEELVVSGLRDSVGLDEPATRRERSAAREALESLGLVSLAGRRTREVSYGQLRMALFARAFVKKPELLLLDEPFTGLDPARRRELRRELSRLARRGTRLVIAIHHRDDLPREVNRRLHLKKGRGEVVPLR